MRKRLDLTGQRFGRLIAGRIVGKKGAAMLWACRCDCGKIANVTAGVLRQGSVISCGCATEEYKRRPGRYKRQSQQNTPPELLKTYTSWAGMRQRCINKNNKNYPRYGGSGITIATEWGTFEQFLKDMGLRPEGTSLDRKDPHGNYTPANCRWATPTEQNRNQRKAPKLTLQTAGEIKWLAEHGYQQKPIAEHYGVATATVSKVYRNRKWKDAPPVKPPEDLIARLPRRALAYNPDLPFNK